MILAGIVPAMGEHPLVYPLYGDQVLGVQRYAGRRLDSSLTAGQLLGSGDGNDNGRGGLVHVALLKRRRRDLPL
jgi:hypothetical protein